METPRKLRDRKILLAIYKYTPNKGGGFKQATNSAHSYALLIQDRPGLNSGAKIQQDEQWIFFFINTLGTIYKWKLKHDLQPRYLCQFFFKLCRPSVLSNILVRLVELLELYHHRNWSSNNVCNHDLTFLWCIQFKSLHN